MELFVNRKDAQYQAKLVKNDDIFANDCNLSVSSYVEPINPFMPESGKKKQTVIEKLKAYLRKFINTNE